MPTIFVIKFKIVGVSFPTDMGKDPNKVSNTGAEHTFLGSERHGGDDLATNKHTCTTESERWRFTQLWGAHEEITPLLLPFCIAPQWLVGCYKVWLHG
jgi:hypothetical protein